MRKKKEIEKNENNIVKKAEQLVTSRYSLTPTEIKIISTLIMMVKVSDTEFQEYLIKVADWKNERELKRKDIYEAFRDIATDLMKKPVTIRSSNGDWLVANWVSSARYVQGQGVVRFKISDELKPYLLQLQKRFLQYDIKNILSLKSAYSIRMYELLKDWYSIESRYQGNKTVTKIVEIVWLRLTFQIPKKYKYNNIKVQILQKAEKDLREHTDLTFTFEEIKESRKVTHIKFSIRQKAAETQKKLVYATDIARQTAIATLALLPEKYRTTAAERLLNKYKGKGLSYIKAQIIYVNESDGVVNYLAYLKKSLLNDYAGVKKSGLTADIKAKQNQVASEQKKTRQEKEEKDKAEKIAAKNEYEKYKKQYEDLSDKKREDLIYKVALHSQLIRKQIKNGVAAGLKENNSIIKARVIAEMIKNGNAVATNKNSEKVSDDKAIRNQRRLDIALGKI